MATVKINKAGLNKVMAQIAGAIETNDKLMRQSWQGSDRNEAFPHVAASLRSIGLELPPETLTAYTDSIVNGEDFEFVLST